MAHKINIIIVAAGSGTRFGAARPKQFCDLAGRWVLEHSIETFRRAIPDADVTLVLSEDGREMWRDYCRKTSYQSPRVVIGGDTRADSVYNALKNITDVSSDGIVLIHDGARPLLPEEVIYNVLSAVKVDTGVIPVVAVTDSLRECEGISNHAVDRSRFYAVQTPQGFNLKALIDAYDTIKIKSGYTDDASVFEAGGGKIVVVDGSSVNIKITNPSDLAVAESLMKFMNTSNSTER